MAEQQTGVILESGPSDWQILQQDSKGFGLAALAGRWVGEAGGRVEVRAVWEATGVAVSRDTDWQAADTLSDGSWQSVLRIPAGGLYRLETRYRPKAQTAGEWSPRGDMRHFLGVGDLWVIAGQSNSAGYGRGPVQDPPELGVHLLRNCDQWMLAAHPMNESTDTRHICNREAANSGHSPYLQFARLLQAHRHYPIGLIQTSLGGSPLSAWNPTQPGDPVLFTNMLQTVQKVGGKVRGVLWYQGESDAGGENAVTYADRFVKAVQAWRDKTGIPDLMVVTVQLNRVLQPANPDGDKGWSQVREAQRQVPRRLAGVVVVPSLDLPLSDAIHTSPAGNMLLGERMARAALGGLYGEPVDWQAPEIQSAQRAGGGREIELRFAPVTSRMDTVDAVRHSFRVEDEAGLVPVEKALFPQDARVKLLLARSLQGRTTVHGAYGLDPATVPMDMERFLPMLGFYGVPVG